MQKLGQHFLKNGVILEKIVDALALADGDCVIEIGPGHGELTAPLVRAARGKHCEIFCIEKDHALIRGLELFAAGENSANDPYIKIIEGDALKLLSEIVTKKISGASPSHYKIVGNIPYYITGKLLRTIGELTYKPTRLVLLIQKEVAERICAAPPDMNRLAASIQFWADTEIVAPVPRKDFSPAPDVDSAVIVLKAHQTLSAAPLSIDPALYYRAMRAIFSQPRKTLLNNLSAATEKITEKDDIAAQLKKIGIAPDARPQDIGVEQIIAIARIGLWE